MTDSSAGQPRSLAERIVGVTIPPIVLSGFRDARVDLGRFAAACPLVIYIYPGSCSSPADGEQTPLLDAAQHRAFCTHQRDLEARGYSVMGISSQPKDAQKQSVLAGRLTQRLLSDPELHLAWALELPTFDLDGASWYQRVTLVAREGRIEKAFSPVASAVLSAAQVLAWMQAQGI
jgi:peroxiredoxin